MKYCTTVLVLTLLHGLLIGQIKINSPYQKKEDKSYIPDSNTPDNTGTNAPADMGGDEVLIGQVVQDLFSAMNESNGNKIKSLFAAEGRLLSTNQDGSINTLSIDDFSTQISQSAKGSLEERINSMEIRVDDHLATAWVEYDFFYNKNLHHCGVDAFQLYKGSSGWKIIQITDTRRENCVAGGRGGYIGEMLDKWHLAASDANASAYFGALANEAVYLGTDASERWNKEEFIAFAKPFFEKGNAWSFNARERNVYFSDDGQMAWFDELLDTWMGTCRGSGVLKKQSDQSWKIMQYNLAILVPNAVVQEYIKLVESKL
ncbi:MAG: nuclear transport factor 2 family protein [Saprospiraceae bacterium]|nr:nuclear transport factor 2 family protein [Saprospiraceae bacterium]